MALRRLLRTHHVAIDWLSESPEGDGVFLRYVNTKNQVAGIFTKGFNSGEARSALHA